MALGQKIKEIASSKPPPLATGSKKKKNLHLLQDQSKGKITPKKKGPWLAI